MTLRRVTVGGVELAVATSGDGPSCLVLHGFTGSAAAMHPLTEGLDATVIALDIVGHGASEAPDDVESYRMDAIVAQIDGVLDALGVEAVVIVGYSFGARVALSYTVAHPGRVRHLVTIGGTAGLDDAAEAAARRTADDALAADIEAHGIEAFVDTWEQASIFATQRDLPDPVRATIRSGRLANRPVGLANSLRGAGTGAMPSLWDALTELTVPCTIVVGALDTKFSEIGERMAALLPNAVVESIPGVGHAAHLEAPAACRGIVQRVLGAS